MSSWVEHKCRKNTTAKAVLTHLEDVDHTELCEVANRLVRIHNRHYQSEYETKPQLDEVFLEQPCQERDGLPSNQRRFVLETERNVWQVSARWSKSRERPFKAIKGIGTQ
jgi:hypothetical protein